MSPAVCPRKNVVRSKSHARRQVQRKAAEVQRSWQRLEQRLAMSDVDAVALVTARTSFRKLGKAERGERRPQLMTHALHKMVPTSAANIVSKERGLPVEPIPAPFLLLTRGIRMGGASRRTKPPAPGGAPSRLRAHRAAPKRSGRDLPRKIICRCVNTKTKVPLGSRPAR